MWYPTLVEARDRNSRGIRYGEGAFAHRISVGVSRRGELRGLLVRTALAGFGFVCPACRRRPRGRAEEPGVHLRMLRLRPPDFHHGGHGDAPHKASVDGMVLGRGFDVDTFKRHVGAATGGTNSASPTGRLGCWRRSCGDRWSTQTGNLCKGVVEVDQAEIPFREGDTFLESPAMLAKSSSSGPSR